MATTNNPTTIIIFLVFFIIWAGFTFLIVTEHKNKIRDALEKKKATPSRISWVPFDFDRNNHTYEVEYIDKEGKKHLRSCKIHTWGSTIYWEDESSEEEKEF